MTPLSIGLNTTERPPNVRAAVKYWKTLIARGQLQHGIHVPHEPKGRDAIETAEAFKVLKTTGIVTVKATSDWGTHYVLSEHETP